MTAALPPELSGLLNARDEVGRNGAWEEFVARHSRLLIHAVRPLGGGYDEMMDRYAYVLDQLREDDFRRLRAYSPSAKARFSTWLVVVARRIAVDHHRRTYGRERATAGDQHRSAERARGRKHLANLMGAGVDLDTLIDTGNPDPEARVVEAEGRATLEAAVRLLPERDRLLVSLRFTHNASVREIGEVMGFPSQFHVYRRLKKVLAVLRENLEEKGMHDLS